jgi:hypothetical protein
MWLSVWSRAVILPAFRRALAVWCGAGIVAAVIFGGNAMQPRDLTSLALHDPAAGAMLGVTWLLLFVPTARILVRADAALYLRALPHREWPPRLVAVSALVVLQLPWLALWLAGEGARGLAVVGVVTGPVILLAAWRPRREHARVPRWRSPLGALAGVYVRGLARKAGDALVRGVGLAVLAGVAGALVVRNNGLAGAHAATLASAVIAIVLVPALVGVLLPLRDAHRSSAALAASLGISERARIAVLAGIVAGVHAVAAIVGAAVVVAMTGVVLAVPVAVATGLGAALVTTRVLARARDATRIVIGAIVAAAIAVVCLGWLDAQGSLLAMATGLVAVLSTRPE